MMKRVPRSKPATALALMTAMTLLVPLAAWAGSSTSMSSSNWSTYGYAPPYGNQPSASMMSEMSRMYQPYLAYERDVTGMTVRDASGNRIGTISDVIVDVPGDDISYALVEPSPLSMRRHVVPLPAMQLDMNRNAAYVDISSQQFRDSPWIEAGKLPSLNAPWQRHVDSFYMSTSRQYAAVNPSAFGSAMRPSAYFSGKNMRGWDAIGRNGNDVGDVNDIVLDLHSGRPAFAIVGVGGFLGVGEEVAPVPWADVHLGRRYETLRIDATRNELAEVAVATKSELNLNDPQELAEVYRVFNTQPTFESYGYMGSSSNTPSYYPQSNPQYYPHGNPSERMNYEQYNQEYQYDQPYAPNPYETNEQYDPMNDPYSSMSHPSWSGSSGMPYSSMNYPEPSYGTMMPSMGMSSDLYYAEDMIGWTVVDQKGTPVGQIEDVMIDTRGDGPCFALVSSTGSSMYGYVPGGMSSRSYSSEYEEYGRENPYDYSIRSSSISSRAHVVPLSAMQFNPMQREALIDLDSAEFRNSPTISTMGNERISRGLESRIDRFYSSRSQRYDQTSSTMGVIPRASYRSVNEMLGWSTRGLRDEDLGDLANVVIDTRSGTPVFAIVSYGGRFGNLANAEKAPIPWTLARVDPREQVVHVAASPEDLRQVAFQGTPMIDMDFADNVYRTFNVQPYWESYGYMSSGRMMERSPSHNPNWSNRNWSNPNRSNPNWNNPYYRNDMNY